MGNSLRHDLGVGYCFDWYYYVGRSFYNKYDIDSHGYIRL